jgi:hypothetical protein
MNANDEIENLKRQEAITRAERNEARNGWDAARRQIADLKVRLADALWTEQVGDYMDAMRAVQALLLAFGNLGGVSPDADKALAMGNQVVDHYLKNRAPKGPKPGDVLFDCTADAAASEIFDFIDRHIGIPLHLSFVGGTVTGVILSVGTRYVRISTNEKSAISPDTKSFKVTPWRGLRRAVLA